MTLRGFAQVSSSVEDYKRATVETLKKKKVLRKELAAKSGDTNSDDGAGPSEKKSKNGAGPSEKKSEDGVGPSKRKSKEGTKKKRKKLLAREEVNEPKPQNFDVGAGDKKTDECSYLKKLLLL